ncbi:MAG TPA: winged helix-turn-helix domain-containing protein [Thermoanaerobaculia bacterium]|nr:winged helix-turn-helix domain-containing protein [Thermoanaerobaculia bacterium]
MDHRTRRRFAFGPFTLDPVSVELQRGTIPIQLRPKCFDLLLYFVENPGRLITKDELLRDVWNDVIVNEGTINRTVTSLRASLGDDADAPAYIETVSRRGYKFIAPVESTATTVAPPAPGAQFALVHDGREIPLPDGEHIIGRGADAAIPLFGSATSRYHARVVVSGTSVTIEDLESRNGTFVNGQRASGAVALHSGDEVRIGDARLVLWSRGSETASATD